MRVVLDRLGHRFHEHWLFRDLSVTFTPNGLCALTGPSGSGKSTLLSIIAEWLPPTEGTVERVGIAKTSWVFQNSHGVARRSAIDHLQWSLLARGASRPCAERRAAELLDQFALAHRAHTAFGNLSGGEAQRLMLARAVGAQPDLLLVDEPTAQLDSHTSQVVNRCMRHVAREGSIVLIATHDPGTKDQCDSVIDLSDSRISGR